MVVKIKKSDKFDNLLYVGLFIFSLISLIVFGNKLLDARNELVESKARIAKLDGDLASLDELVKEEDRNADKINALKASLPSSYAEVSSFAQKLEKLAQDENENIELSIDKDKIDEGGVSSLKFSIKTKGNYLSLKNTLTLLSQIPYHTKVDSLKVESEEGSLVTLTNFRLLMK